MVDIVTYGMAKAYADKAVNGAVTSVYTYKGRCTHAELAGKTKTAGDVWAMSDSGDTWQVGQEYCYDPAANQWVAMTGLRTTVINSLSSTSTHDALSAAQGKALNDNKADRTELTAKQDVLTAGENITIVNNVISATGGGGGGGGDAYTKAETDALLDEKQDVLTAGSGIVLNDNEISVGGYSAGEQRTNTPDADHSFPRFNITTDMKVFDTSASQDNLCVIRVRNRGPYDPESYFSALIYTHKGTTQTYTLSDYDNGTFAPLFISDTMYVSGYIKPDGSEPLVYVVYIDYDTGELRRQKWGPYSNMPYDISYFESDNGPGIQIRLNQHESEKCMAKCPSWASVPAPDGNYTRFDESYVSSDLGGLYTNSQVSFIAYSASSYSWNSDCPLLLCSGLSFKTSPLVPHMQGTSGYVTGASWGAPSSTPAPVTPPVSLPSIDTITMAPPTPTYTDGDWGYDLDGNDAIIVCYTGSDTDITIPSTVGGHTVTAIGRGTEGAIIWTPPGEDDDVELTFTLPNTVTHINAYAFAEWCIVSNLPSGVTTIGDRAFYWTTTDFTIPASVVSIGIEAFGGGNDTEAYTVDAANPAYMSRDGILFSKDGTKLIRFPPNSSVFNGETYTIPETVTEIAASAFQEVYSPERIVLPEKGPKIIGDSAFDYCGSYILPSADTGNYPAFNIPSTVQYIGAYAFLNTTIHCGDLILPESIISIGAQAFRDVSVDAPLVLPSSLQSIGEDAFDGNISGVFNYSQIDIMQGNTGLENVDPSKVSTQPLTAIGYFAPIDVLTGDIAPYYSRFEADALLGEKQDVLTAGTNITIENNVISAGGANWVRRTTSTFLQNDLEVGTNDQGVSSTDYIKFKKDVVLCFYSGSSNNGGPTNRFTYIPKGNYHVGTAGTNYLELVSRIKYSSPNIIYESFGIRYVGSPTNFTFVSKELQINLSTQASTSTSTDTAAVDGDVYVNE